VFCQLIYLRRCIPGRIRRALDELPETLDETYARTLEEIDEQNRDYAHRLFQCVAAASRPLLVNELAEFLAFDFEAGLTPTFLADWRPEDPTHAVLSVCSSLLAVVEPEGGSLVVQFAHFSVKEYLTSARLAKATATVSRFHVSMTAAHTIVAQACLGVLLHLDENITKDSLEEFPLAEYAAEHWVGHARYEDVSLKVQDGMKRLFDPSESYLFTWVWVHDPEDSDRRIRRYERPVEARATPLHYAAFCGLHDVAAFLIVERSQDVNARGFKWSETPLHVASRCGHVEVVWVLLEHGAFMEIRDENNWNTLDRASSGGHVEIAKVLLEHGVDVNAQDKSNWTPLYVAEGEEVTRVLLEHGADVNALDIDGMTPLHKASEMGRAGTVRALLEHGVDANARDSKNATPLHLGSERTKPDVARLLLQYGSDVHARDGKGRTPFMRATEGRCGAVMDLLLECGAEDHRK
jgi:ankyrin repeat protein